MITLRNLGKLCGTGIKSQIPLHIDRLLYIYMFTPRKIRIVGVCFENFEENCKTGACSAFFAKRAFTLQSWLSERGSR
jgi:hypothetical protein